jgi:hypothetical protein
MEVITSFYPVTDVILKSHVTHESGILKEPRSPPIPWLILGYYYTECVLAVLHIVRLPRQNTW